MNSLGVRNRQRFRAIDLPHFRHILQHLLDVILRIPEYDLGIEFISASAMAKINQRQLGHSGPTDVITFDYADPRPGARRPSAPLHGEIVVCPEIAFRQAASFGTTWTAELIRYAIHGILHLLGYDDLTPAKRRRMKIKENQLLRQIARTFQLPRLDKQSWTKKPKASSCASAP